MRRVVLAALLVACLPLSAYAQDFGVLESAETINKHNFKLRATPIPVFGKNGEDDRTGVAILAGYGFTSNFDLEGGVSMFDGVTFFGANGEVWLAKESPLDISLAAGLHRRTGDRTFDMTGLDLTFLVSGHVSNRFELYGGLDLAFEGLGDPPDYKTAHLVPGLEYKINDDLDFVAELGLALNDHSRHYIGAGLAFYLR